MTNCERCNEIPPKEAVVEVSNQLKFFTPYSVCIDCLDEKVYPTGKPIAVSQFIQKHRIENRLLKEFSVKDELFDYKTAMEQVFLHGEKVSRKAMRPSRYFYLPPDSRLGVMRFFIIPKNDDKHVMIDYQIGLHDYLATDWYIFKED